MASNYKQLELTSSQIEDLAADGKAAEFLTEQLKAAQADFCTLGVFVDGYEADLVDLVDLFQCTDDVIYCDNEECQVCGTAWRMGYRSADGSERLGYCTCCDTLIAYVDEDVYIDNGYNYEAEPEHDREELQEDWLLCD